MSVILETLGALPAARLHFTDVSRAFGGFDGSGNASSRVYHRDAQRLLASWCCTAEAAFQRTAGRVPYLLPPLPGQRAWRGEPDLQWAARALSAISTA